ncbi:protein Z-dependent protease inhibitor-like [Pholidichthys leucotaenia]
MTPPTSLSLVGLFFMTLLSPASSQDLTARNAYLGVKLYQSIAAGTDDNVLLSPFTMSTALLALLSAANGPTQEQLLQRLTLTGLDPTTIPDVFQVLKDQILTAESALRQGVGIFPGQGSYLSSAYGTLVQMKYGGIVQSLPYSSPYDAADTINRWAMDQTGDKVKDMVSIPNPQTQLLIAAATAYQTRFSPPFNSSSTQEVRFYVNNYRVVMVPMMFRADKYFLAYDASMKVGVLKLPMADGTAMLAVLPDEGMDITTVEEDVTAEKIWDWILKLKKTKLEVQFPRFQLERSYALKDVLQTLNISQVFQDDADLSKMGGAKGPKLTEVFHKSVISVDETSSDSSGGGGATFTSPQPRLTFNRPFIIIVYHQSSSSLLLMARVNDPTQT